MTQNPPENAIDLRELRLNTLWISICYIAFIGPLDFMLLIPLFHYLDWGWAARQFSPFGKISRGILNLAGPDPVRRPAAPHQKWAKVQFVAGCFLVGDFLTELPWIFEGIAAALILLAILEAMEKLSGKEQS